MNDNQIIELYFKRDDRAITETENKYGSYCTKIAMNILNDILDSEECVSDTWFAAWRSIPPKKPAVLAAYLGKITRNLSINRYKLKHADKRGANEFALSLDELGECSASYTPFESSLLAEEIGKCISDFLRMQKPLDRRVFVCRYFFCDSVSDISKHFEISESRVKSLLFRMRGKLKSYLEKNGISV